MKKIKPHLLRQKISLGEESFNFLRETKILVVNLSTVGVEIVKNLSFLNIETIGILDD